MAAMPPMKVAALFAALHAADFKAGVNQLVQMGYGDMITGAPLTYKATQEIP